MSFLVKVVDSTTFSGWALLRGLVLELEHRSGYPEAPSYEHMKKRMESLQDSEVPMFIGLAFTDRGDPAGALVAVMGMDPFAPENVAMKLHWGVSEEAQNGGAGQMLVDAYEAWAVEHGAVRAFLGRLESAGTPTNKAFEAMGYLPIESSFAKEL